MTSIAAKLPVLALLLSALAVGCAAEDGGATTGSEDEVRGRPNACISQLPTEVFTLAARLDLGQPKSSDGAAGSIYYTFANGSVVRWSNVESKVSEVRLVAKGDGEPRPVPLEVGVAAAEHALGGLVESDGAAGSIYFTFARGVVRWSNVESKLSSVQREDGSEIEPAGPLAETKAGDVCLDTLSAPIWSLAAGLDLGPPTASDGAAGSIYYSFANGSVIRWSNVESKVSEVRLAAGKEEPTDVPVAVANAAKNEAFGGYVSSDGAAGSIYYTFARGVVRWSNVESKVSEVRPR